MPLDFSIQPPAWLTKAATDDDPGNGLHAFQIGAQLALQKQKMAMDAQVQKVDLAAKMQAMDLQHKNLVDNLNGGIEVAGWLKDTGSDPAKMVDTPYTGTNPFAAKQIEAMQSQARQSTIVKTQQKAAELAAENDAKTNFAFQEGMGTIPLDDQVRIRAMSSGKVTPEQLSELNTVRTSNGMLPVGAKQSDYQRADSPIGKLISDRDAALARGDDESVSVLNDAITKAKSEAMGTAPREIKLMNYANELRKQGDPEKAAAVDRVALHQYGGDKPINPIELSKLVNARKVLLKDVPENEPEPQRLQRENLLMEIDRELKMKQRIGKPKPVTPLNTAPASTNSPSGQDDPLGILK